MHEVFEIIRVSHGEKGEKILRLGIRVRMAGYETLCPVTEPCRSYQGAQVEIERLKRDLDGLLKQVKDAFEGDASGKVPGITAEMDAEQIWGILAKITEDRTFMQGFNELEETRRREVAEHILTRCNIFSGRASFFSSRYNEASGLME